MEGSLALAMAAFRALEADARKGRSAVATRAIPAGSRVLSTPPFAHVSLSACSWCLSGASLSRCGGCQRARYCSRRCQQADWADGGHRNECAAWKAVLPSGGRPQTLLLVARLAAKMYLSPSTPPEDAAEVEQLRHHDEDHTPEKLAQFRDMARLVLLLLARSKLNADGKSVEQLGDELMGRVVRLFCRVNCNAFTICDDANAPVGIGLFPRGALFNHSCTPNCVVSFRGREMVVHAVRNLSPGDELTVSYVELLESTTKRRHALRASYFFDCDCRRCEMSMAQGSSDDWFLDGLECLNEDCSDGVVVVADPVEETEGAPDCRACGEPRAIAGIARCQQKMRDLRRQMEESRHRGDATEITQWQLCQQLWEIARHDLYAHPKSTLVAALARDIGNFLMDADVAALVKSGGAPPRALPFFLEELHASEWVIPEVPLPSRGLLHFQIAKLIVEEGEQQHGSSPHSRSKVELIEDADRHIKTALSVLGCALGTDSQMFERAALFQQDIERLRGMLYE